MILQKQIATSTYLSSIVLMSCQRKRPLRVATKATDMPNSLNMACLYIWETKREKNQKYYFHVIDQKFLLKDPTSEGVGLF